MPSPSSSSNSSERIVSGLAAARARGRNGGRPRKLTNEQLAGMKAMFDSRDHTVATIGRVFGDVETITQRVPPHDRTVFLTAETIRATYHA